MKTESLITATQGILQQGLALLDECRRRQRAIGRRVAFGGEDQRAGRHLRRPQQDQPMVEFLHQRRGVSEPGDRLVDHSPSLAILDPRP